jgi:hypothetical protein
MKEIRYCEYRIVVRDGFREEELKDIITQVMEDYKDLSYEKIKMVKDWFLANYTGVVTNSFRMQEKHIKP